ncbi:MAG: alpha/beta fold hydrolase [Chloroflexi bacterium]|nr:alpha/beta fold hydrolase [Chloroflexota bacterium]
MQLEWQYPEFRRWFERLARERRVVRYESRGHGLSDRDVVDRSLDAYVLDLEAVVDSLGLERFTLMGVAHMGPVAIAYAVHHPERVSHLILWSSFARASDYVASRQGEFGDELFAKLLDK